MILKGEMPEIMKEIFPINIATEYNFRRRREFFTRKVRTVHFGIDSIAYLAPKIWEIVPSNIKESCSIVQFKKRIKNGFQGIVLAGFVKHMCQILVTCEFCCPLSPFFLKNAKKFS